MAFRGQKDILKIKYQNLDFHWLNAQEYTIASFESQRLYLDVRRKKQNKGIAKFFI